MNFLAELVRRSVALIGSRGVAAAICGALSIAVTADVARPHSHKNADGTVTSWYPHECCHDGDCRPVARLVRAPQGLWLTTVDGYTILIGPNDRRRPSRDMRWHVCINSDIEATADTIRCVFEPPDS